MKKQDLIKQHNMHIEKCLTSESPNPSSSTSSRLPGFYELPISERLEIVKSLANLSTDESKALHEFGALNPEMTDIFIENAIGTFAMPLGVATNFLINGRDILIPMAVEETSVLAAASHGAKLARAGEGFKASSTEPVMTGQIQIFTHQSELAMQALSQHKEELLRFTNRGHERLLSRGGGAKDLTWRFIPELNCLVLHVDIHTGDAMGANIVNTMCEKLATQLPKICHCSIGLRILTNLTDKRTATAKCLVPHTALNSADYDGREVARRIVMAYEFAYFDIYRATTNNKGIMNGIDPVLIATGNDWRAIEAGAHAYASRDGVYRPLAKWSLNSDGDLCGELTVPMAVGTVGGVTKLHPSAKAALKLLGSPNARELAEITVSVGLAQNLSALRALASEGIQRGHMSLHQANLQLLTTKDERQGAARK